MEGKFVILIEKSQVIVYDSIILIHFPVLTNRISLQFFARNP